MTLLAEIQKEAADGTDLVAVLKKCKILAARLGSVEFAQWISWELDGYPTEQPVPSYRRINAQYYANFMGAGWSAERQPFLWPVLGDAKYENFNPIEFRDGIAKAVAFTKGARVNRPELGFIVQGKMFPDLNCVGTWVEISGSEFQQLLSAVSCRILDFALQIEAANPAAGEAPINSHPVPAEKLQPLVQNFFGPVGNIAQNSHGFSQTTHLGITTDELKRLTHELAEHLVDLKLTREDQRTVEAQLATISAQITDTPNPVIVREAAKTIRNLTEGAIGNFIAAATQPTVFGWIQTILAKF